MKFRCHTCNKDLDPDILGIHEIDAREFHNRIHRSQALEQGIAQLKQLAEGAEGQFSPLSLSSGRRLLASRIRRIADSMSREDYINPPVAEAGQPSPVSKPKCRIGWHQVTYAASMGVAWCKKCKMEADMEVCRENRAEKRPADKDRFGTGKAVKPPSFKVPKRDTLQ